MFVALVLAGFVFWCVGLRVSRMREAADEQKRKQPEMDLMAIEQDRREKIIGGMKETNDLFINWAVVTLGGTLGIAILGKGVKIPHRNWAMIFFPAVWILLLAGSLQNGSMFKRSLTFQHLTGKYVLADLNLYLYLQLDFFEKSLYGLAVIAVIYLFYRFARSEQ